MGVPRCRLTDHATVVIHGHYYQPPRADPSTGQISIEPSAAPFPNWNARITDECYRSNTCAAILESGDGSGVAERINNYAFTSFNFGPTLLEWMTRAAPDVYAEIVRADALSRKRLAFGNAIAQSMNHTILPLAAPRDRETEIRWGIDDFEHHFGRAPRGMWLPECAADLATLDALVRAGIEFTILAPRQCRATRAAGGEWSEAEVDPSRPYRINVPSGGSIVVFFYDGGLSQSVAFDGLLDDGARFAERLRSRRDAGITHIATDGETYGHHHRYGEMALAFAIRELRDAADVTLSNYTAFLAENPPEHEALVRDPSSWSCAHGVERWRSDCSCALGPSTPGDQAWRTPLRDGLNWLRTTLVAHYAESIRALGADPWSLRNGYHAARLEGPEGLSKLVQGIDQSDQARARELIDLQRVMLTMFTSCGWFFDSPDDIATRLDIKAATEAARRFEALSGRAIRQEFAARMKGVEGAMELISP